MRDTEKGRAAMSWHVLDRVTLEVGAPDVQLRGPGPLLLDPGMEKARWYLGREIQLRHQARALIVTIKQATS